MFWAKRKENNLAVLWTGLEVGFLMGFHVNVLELIGLTLCTELWA